jgi:hypothetical protein
MPPRAGRNHSGVSSCVAWYEMVPGGRVRVIARVAALYTARLRETGEAPGINAPTNQDAHDISAAVRVERRKLGQLGADIRTVPATDGERDYPLALAAGDRVRLFRSTPASFGAGKGGSIGRNGSVVEVVDADDRGLTVRAKSGRVGRIAWDELQVASGRVRLAYGDALTIHTAQGSSRREQISAFPDGTEKVLGQAAHSAMTRHYLTGWMVTSEQAERASAGAGPVSGPYAGTQPGFRVGPLSDCCLAVPDGRAGRTRCRSRRLGLKARDDPAARLG